MFFCLRYSLMRVLVATLKDHVNSLKNKMKCKKHFFILCLIMNVVNSLRPSGYNIRSF